jgi:Tfp pilus assembly protein PilN
MAIELNLLPREVCAAQARARHVRTWITCGAPVLLVLLGLLALDGVRGVQAADLRDQVAGLTRTLSARRAEVKNLTESLAEATLHLKRSDALRAKRNWSDVLVFIGRHMPKECWLESVATDPDSPSPGTPVAPAKAAAGKTNAPTTVTIDAPRKLRIGGHSLDSAAPLTFVANLKESGVFAKVALEHSVLEPDARLPRFRFEVLVEW